LDWVVARKFIVGLKGVPGIFFDETCGGRRLHMAGLLVIFRDHLEHGAIGGDTRKANVGGAVVRTTNVNGLLQNVRLPGDQKVTVESKPWGKGC